jgi:hypothetical protein
MLACKEAVSTTSFRPNATWLWRLDDLWAKTQATILEPAFAPDVEPVQRLARFFRYVADRQRAYVVLGCPFGNLAAELGAQDPVIRDRVRHVFGGYQTYFERTFGDAAAAGQLRELMFAAWRRQFWPTSRAHYCSQRRTTTHLSSTAWLTMPSPWYSAPTETWSLHDPTPQLPVVDFSHIGPSVGRRADLPSVPTAEQLRLHVEVSLPPEMHVFAAPVPDGFTSPSPHVEPLDWLNVGPPALPTPQPLSFAGLEESFSSTRVPSKLSCHSASRGILEPR